MQRVKQQDVPANSAFKTPDEWVTGDEPMTGAQESYLHTLAREAGKSIQDDLTKAEASEKIEELQQQTGRGATNRPRLKVKRGPRPRSTARATRAKSG